MREDQPVGTLGRVEHRPREDLPLGLVAVTVETRDVGTGGLHEGMIESIDGRHDDDSVDGKAYERADDLGVTTVRDLDSIDELDGNEISTHGHPVALGQRPPPTQGLELPSRQRLAAGEGDGGNLVERDVDRRGIPFRAKAHRCELESFESARFRLSLGIAHGDRVTEGRERDAIRLPLILLVPLRVFLGIEAYATEGALHFATVAEKDRDPRSLLDPQDLPPFYRVWTLVGVIYGRSDAKPDGCTAGGDEGHREHGWCH